MLALVSISFTLQAQKYGYINSDALIAEMPKVKQMQPELESLQKILNKKRETMITDLQAKQQDAQRKYEQGLLSPADQETVQAQLVTGQQEIAAYEQTMQNDLLKKQQELLDPILKQVDDAIKQVAKENGYTMIFNSAVLLYADEAQDVSAQVKAKLNL